MGGKAYSFGTTSFLFQDYVMNPLQEGLSHRKEAKAMKEVENREGFLEANQHEHSIFSNHL